ncbi:hypothetical protein OBBRIDRAFT_836746 [Obba rivulosa]|uniref:Uncharacterized protein n=1 Tax=Obba rivulosa TaxID=1052685 RepID=A0A8E2DIQ3_9APHY|nr:hypothetical protein OBBRIDRAFT_836746 [Obba rivulosa]
MASSAELPVLLPQNVLPRPLARNEWTPKRDPSVPVPPPGDDARTHDQEMVIAHQHIDGKTAKKVRPWRTVDYNGPMGRWNLMSPQPPKHKALEPSGPSKWRVYTLEWALVRTFQGTHNGAYLGPADQSRIIGQHEQLDRCTATGALQGNHGGRG